MAMSSKYRLTVLCTIRSKKLVNYKIKSPVRYTLGIATLYLNDPAKIPDLPQIEYNAEIHPVLDSD